MSSYLHHHPPKSGNLLSVLLLFLYFSLSLQGPACSTVGQLKCKCVDLTYNCSNLNHKIMPIMLDPRLKVLDLSHNQIKKIHDLNSIYISIEQLDISYNLINSNESSSFESKNLKVSLVFFRTFFICIISARIIWSLIDKNVKLQFVTKIIKKIVTKLNLANCSCSF